MSTLMNASRQWSTRADEERYLNLPDMAEHFDAIRATSRAVVVPSRKLTIEPDGTDTEYKGLMVTGPNGHAYAPTHHAFGQLATLAKAPAGYLRTLPAPIAADAMNYGLQFSRDIDDVGILLQSNGVNTIRAATGPNYGRVWNSTIVRALMDRFGDGRTGQFVVPGEFGKRVDISKANTTLYASDKDMFVFLADETNRIEIPNRRNGESGSLARGFFVWNSEVGDCTLGVMTFLFDYVCCNRIVWGASGVQEIKVRHTSAAPERWAAEVAPAMQRYADSSATGVQQAITQAREAHLVGQDLDNFLAKRFTKAMASTIKNTHQQEEGRPIESLWDVTTGLTAVARNVAHQSDRVALERQAGTIMGMAL